MLNYTLECANKVLILLSEHVVMDDILMMGGDTCDRYDEHGVKIDYQYT